MTADEAGGWQPAFPGQRPPFRPGHEASLRSGARSPRKVGPLAAEIEHEARAAAWWPDYLRDPSFAPEIQAWAWAEAQVRLLRAYVGDLDLTDGLTDTSTEVSDETHAKGRSHRVTTGRRTQAAYTQLSAAESRAARYRSRLGLEPTARAKLQRDLAAGRYMQGLSTGHPLLAALERRRPSGQRWKPQVATRP